MAALALRAGVMLLRIAVLALVIVSMNEVLKAIADIIRNLIQNHELMLFGALIAVLVPAGGVFFWGCKTIFMSFKRPIGFMARYFQNYRDGRPPMRGGARPQQPSAASPADRPGREFR